jgi:hypothetical protein
MPLARPPGDGWPARPSASLARPRQQVLRPTRSRPICHEAVPSVGIREWRQYLIIQPGSTKLGTPTIVRRPIFDFTVSIRILKRCRFLKPLKRLARPERLELPTPRFVVWCSIQLSYGRTGRHARAGAEERGKLAATRGDGKPDRSRRPRPIAPRARQRNELVAGSTIAYYPTDSQGRNDGLGQIIGRSRQGT